MLKNRHILVAGLVAPLLALMSYYAIDFFISEKPHAAEPGSSYQLVEKPDCRWASGSCGLKNGDFELRLVPERGVDGQVRLTLRSEFPLDGVMIALVETGEGERPPVNMLPVGDDGMVWSIGIGNPDTESDRMRLVASTNQALWYGDVATTFVAALSGNE
jgi:hypothetical protein